MTFRLRRDIDTFFVRIFLGVLIIVVSQTLFFFAFHYYFEMNFIHELFTNKGSQIVRNLARASASALYLRSRNLIRGPIDAALEDRFVMAVGIYDKEGNAWLLNESFNITTSSVLLPRQLDAFTRLQLDEKGSLSIYGVSAQTFLCPIKMVPSSQWMLESFGEEVKEKTIGYAAIALSKELLEEYANSTRLYTVSVGIAAVIIGLLVAVFMAKMLSSPIRKLSEKAKSDQVVHEKIDFSVEGPKELRELSEALEAFLRARHFFEKALTTERNRLKSVFEAIPDPVYVIEEDYRLVFTNKAFNKRFGKPGTLPCFTQIHHLEGPCPWCPIRLMDGGDEETVFAFYHKRTKAFFEALCRRFSDTGDTSSWLFILKDVTSWKLNQEALERELRENEVLNELSRSLLVVRDDPLKVAEIVLSRSMELTASSVGFIGMMDLEEHKMKVVKISLDNETCGVSSGMVMSFSPKEDGRFSGLHGHALNIKDSFFVNAPSEHMASLGVPDGHVTLENFMAAPAMIGESPYGIIGLANSKLGGYSPRDLKSLERISDIYALALNNLRESHEKERLWKELRQAQKMEAIATLAGGIAHDFNNILAPIMGYAEILLMRAGDDEELRSGLKKIFESAMRAKEIVSQILTFSRSKEGERRPILVPSIVKEAMKLLTSSLPKTIHVEIDIDEAVPSIVADPVHIHQILMNLCTNAFHAMEDSGGTLKVTVDSAEVEGKEFVRLSVSDTGHGIPEEYIDRIFEPYFTTKELGKGTGLGLAMVHGIVETYNGTMNLRSKVGEGTTFEILLPAYKGKGRDGAVDRAIKEKTALPRYSGKVLVVDDEEPVRRVLEGLLRAFGLDVTTASSGEEALMQLQKSPEGFDLIVTDQTMPKITGLELIDTLRRSGIMTPIILCTGYNSKVDEGYQKELYIIEFLVKPVDTKSLDNALKKVFRARSHAV